MPTGSIESESPAIRSKLPSNICGLPGNGTSAETPEGSTKSQNDVSAIGNATATNSAAILRVKSTMRSLPSGLPDMLMVITENSIVPIIAIEEHKNYCLTINFICKTI